MRWKWRRNLLDREVVTFNVLYFFINTATLKIGVQDSWRLTDSSKGVYTTKEAYFILLEKRDVGHVDEEKELSFKLKWNKVTPLKIIAHP